MAVTVCDVEFGCWVCGESWLAIKDSLTHRPSSQGWAPSVLLSCHVMRICVCVLYGYFGVCGLYVGGFYLFISLSIYLSIYLWLVCNFMLYRWPVIISALYLSIHSVFVFVDVMFHIHSANHRCTSGLLHHSQCLCVC